MGGRLPGRLSNCCAGALIIVDKLDRRLLGLLRDHPRGSVTDLARRAEVARGTVYARLERLEATGAIIGYGPEIEPAQAGFGVLGFCTLEIVQGSHESTTRALEAILEILEIHTITGEGDLLCRVAARSNHHLHEILQQVTAIPTVSRSQTQLALHTSLRRSAVDLVVDLANPE